MNDNPTIPQDATTALHRAFGGTHATVMTLLICVLVAALGGSPWMLVITVALAAAGQFIHSFTLVHGYLKAQKG